jgi:acylpyruvate hydrolase
MMSEMELATIRDGDGTAAVRIDGDEAVVLDATDVGAVLRRPDWLTWAAAADGARRPVDGLDLAPLIPAPDKIICVGLNYRTHVLEMGRQLPDHPTLFAKYRRSLIGDGDDIVLPAASEMTDWEAELTVVIGTEVRHADRASAEAAIAGWTVCNDVSVRDWQMRTLQFLQGKTFESSTPLGPRLVTTDQAPGPFAISCEVNGEVVQDSTTADLVFDPVDLVAYCSQIVTLEPGDVIATGTPGGVGMARTPPRFLQDGDVVVTRIDGVGELRNTCRKERLP